MDSIAKAVNEVERLNRILALIYITLSGILKYKTSVIIGIWQRNFKEKCWFPICLLLL